MTETAKVLLALYGSLIALLLFDVIIQVRKFSTRITRAEVLLDHIHKQICPEVKKWEDKS